MAGADGKTLSDAERIDHLRLIRSENVGPITFFQLLKHFGTAASALAAAPDLSRRGGRRKAIKIYGKADAEREVAALSAMGGQFVMWGEAAYPEALAAIADPPPALAVLGHPHLLTRRCLAIVGARNASAAGCRFAAEIAAALGRADLVIVSGMARGIDAAAHAPALGSGTIAVLGAGVDVVYPKENADLYERLRAEGAIIGEQPLGTKPLAQHFPRRNRLIAGLSLGVLVVEAARRSGSLITARMALEQGREVFAVPGSPLDPRCKGTNGLIRDGAVLTESADDILTVLAAMTRPNMSETPPAFAGAPAAPPLAAEIDQARGQVVEKLGPTPVTVDELVRQCHISPAIVLTILLELELAGRLERHAGSRVSRIA